MVIVPKEKPAVENLSSYYLDIQKLLEHYQGEFDSGCIHFRSPSIEGAIFFDKDELLTGVFQNKEGKLKGKAAVDNLTELAAEHSFTIDVHEIDFGKIYFWANLPAAEKVYEDLSTEFTDLERLIKKMGQEKLTGYIDVSINNGEEGGLIFLNNGNIIGGSCSWGKGKSGHSREDLKLLIKKAKESGGTFQVNRISLTKGGVEKISKEITDKLSSNVFTMLEEFLGVLERIIKSKKKIKTDCSTLLKKKFMGQADKYEFLDPFLGEFEYSDNKISFVGDATTEDLVKGIIESVNELADELGILPRLMKELDPWFQEHAEELASYGIKF